MLVCQRVTSVLVDEVLIHPNGGLGVAHRCRRATAAAGCDSQHWSVAGVALKNDTI